MCVRERETALKTSRHCTIKNNHKNKTYDDVCFLGCLNRHKKNLYTDILNKNCKYISKRLEHRYEKRARSVKCISAESVCSFRFPLVLNCLMISLININTAWMFPECVERLRCELKPWTHTQQKPGGGLRWRSDTGPVSVKVLLFGSEEVYSWRWTCLEESLWIFSSLSQSRISHL